MSGSKHFMAMTNDVCTARDADVTIHRHEGED